MPRCFSLPFSHRHRVHRAVDVIIQHGVPAAPHRDVIEATVDGKRGGGGRAAGVSEKKAQEPSRAPRRAKRAAASQKTRSEPSWKRGSERRFPSPSAPASRPAPPGPLPQDPHTPPLHSPALKDVGRVQAALVEDFVGEGGEKVGDRAAQGGRVHGARGVCVCGDVRARAGVLVCVCDRPGGLRGAGRRENGEGGWVERDGMRQWGEGGGTPLAPSLARSPPPFPSPTFTLPFHPTGRKSALATPLPGAARARTESTKEWDPLLSCHALLHTRRAPLSLTLPRPRASLERVGAAPRPAPSHAPLPRALPSRFFPLMSLSFTAPHSGSGSGRCSSPGPPGWQTPPAGAGGPAGNSKSWRAPTGTS